MKNLTTTLMLGLVTISAIASLSTLTASADDVQQSSMVTAKITAGALSFTKPNDDTLTVTLSGKEQTVDLDEAITFDVTDARGLADDKSGWNVTVASENYDSYKGDYTLNIDSKDVNAEAIQVDAVTEKTVTKSESLKAAATVSATAKAATSEVANLQWILAPTPDSAAE